MCAPATAPRRIYGYGCPTTIVGTGVPDGPQTNNLHCLYGGSFMNDPYKYIVRLTHAVGSMQPLRLP